METANEILRQIGGNRFLAMTGCYNLVGDKDSLTMRLRRNKSKAQYLKIRLNGLDLYEMKFFSVTKDLEVKEVEVIGNIYFDQLENIFTNRTGLETRLN